MLLLEQLLAEPIPALRERFLDKQVCVPRGLLEALEMDERHSARDLARRIRARQYRNRAEGQRLRRLLNFECDLWSQGVNLIAGVDEAGMAPLAGPVVAAAVILRKGYKLPGLNDSKKILEPAKREELARAIRADAVAWSVGRAEVEEIDRINIYHAGLLAMRRAIEGLHIRPDFLLVDGRKVPGIMCPQTRIFHGDALSASIAAASIIAKTTRDAHMADMDREFPGYGFASHKGYPTSTHFQALKSLGALPIHRRSFYPVKLALGLVPVQEELFEEPGTVPATN